MPVTSRDKLVNYAAAAPLPPSSAAGCITGSLMAYYFHERFDASDAWLGRLLFGANTIAGLSSLAAGWVAHHFGLINTMVGTPLSHCSQCTRCHVLALSHYLPASLLHVRAGARGPPAELHGFVGHTSPFQVMV